MDKSTIRSKEERRAVEESRVESWSFESREYSVRVLRSTEMERRRDDESRVGQKGLARDGRRRTTPAGVGC